MVLAPVLVLVVVLALALVQVVVLALVLALVVVLVLGRFLQLQNDSSDNFLHNEYSNIHLVWQVNLKQNHMYL